MIKKIINVYRQHIRKPQCKRHTKGRVCTTIATIYIYSLDVVQGKIRRERYHIKNVSGNVTHYFWFKRGLKRPINNLGALFTRAYFGV